MDHRVHYLVVILVSSGFTLLVQGSVVNEKRNPRFFTGNEISFGLEDGIHPNCSVGYIDGFCSFSLECHGAGGFPLGVCRKGFQFGSCCTQRTTISPVNLGVTQPAKDQECGIPEVNPNLLDGRIVNGSMALFGQIPWVVSLRIFLAGFGSESFHFCGGTLLNSEWIITTAHCVYFEDATLLVIRIGEYNSSTTSEPYPFVERKMKLKIVHEDFRIEDFYSDIALLKMETPINYQPNIQPICLPGTDNLLIGSPGVVSGWGRIKENSNEPSEILRTVSLPIMENSICQKLFLKGKVREKIHDLFVCAGYEDGSRDACTGDSGGPLQVKDKDGRVFLAGIVSWGYGCSRPYKPGVYTRISKFVPWIIQKLKT